jgi:hypothetical protein
MRDNISPGEAARTEGTGEDPAFVLEIIPPTSTIAIDGRIYSNLFAASRIYSTLLEKKVQRHKHKMIDFLEPLFFYVKKKTKI